MIKTTFKDLTPENLEYIKHVYYQEMLHVEKMEICLTDLLWIGKL